MRIRQATTNTVGRLIRQLVQIPFLDGRLHSFTIQASSSVKIKHGLGRVPKGFINIGPIQDYNVRIATTSDSEVITFTNFSTDFTDMVVWVY